MKRRYLNQRYDFSMMVPDGWKEIKAGNGVAFVGPDGNGFRPNLNLIVKKAPSIELERYSLRTLSGCRSLDGYSLLVQRPIRVNDLPGYEVVHRFDVEGQGFWGRQVLLLASGRLYQLTFICLENDSKRYEPIFEEWIGSFRSLKEKKGIFGYRISPDATIFD